MSGRGGCTAALAVALALAAGTPAQARGEGTPGSVPAPVLDGELPAKPDDYRLGPAAAIRIAGRSRKVAEQSSARGRLRARARGSAGGHNGLKSMTKVMGPDYHRVRFGIGRPPGRMQVADFVLKDFGSAERKELDYFVDRAADAVECLVIEGLERAQSTYNS